MKRLLLIFLFLLISILGLCQNKGVLKFLDIPIDGTEAQFTAKLKNKGFSYNSFSETYKGQFNGRNVDVIIHTNHNLVDRVYVAFPYTTESLIRNEYNRLLSQFEENSKYMGFGLNEMIPEDEDISYEIRAHNKRYQASYSYLDPDTDLVAFSNALLDKCSDYFSDNQKETLKENLAAYLNLPEEDQIEYVDLVLTELEKPMEEMEAEQMLGFLFTIIDSMKSLSEGEVWFMIHENSGRYQIGLYYDNLHNQAHGEDL